MVCWIRSAKTADLKCVALLAHDYLQALLWAKDCSCGVRRGVRNTRWTWNVGVVTSQKKVGYYKHSTSRRFHCLIYWIHPARKQLNKAAPHTLGSSKNYSNDVIWSSSTFCSKAMTISRCISRLGVWLRRICVNWLVTFLNNDWMLWFAIHSTTKS